MLIFVDSLGYEIGGFNIGNVCYQELFFTDLFASEENVTLNCF